MNDATPYQYFVSTHNLFPINEGLICFITPNIRDTEKTIRYTSNRPCSEKENLYSHGNYDQVSMSQMIELFRGCEISSDIGLIIGFHKRTCTGSFCKKNKCCSQNLKNQIKALHRSNQENTGYSQALCTATRHLNS